MSGYFKTYCKIITLCCMGFHSIGQAIYDENLVPEFQLPEIINVPVENFTIDQWVTHRRVELLNMMAEQMFGHVPEQAVSVDYEISQEHSEALGGIAHLKEIEIAFSTDRGSTSASLLLLIPKSASEPVPMFLGMNFCGNHTIHTDQSIALAKSWVSERCSPNTGNVATATSRGRSSSRWPVEMILERGFGLGVVYYGDLDPDFDDGFENGIHALYRPTDRSADGWGSIATWAWGLSRALDYLEEDPAVNASKVAVIGHSRLGKTALWAGAVDERFSLVISNNSGCGGAALSKRRFGETIQAINTRFPHWFCENFNRYNDQEHELPFDQHMLLAMIAPRPLYVASASEDQWADPKGEYLSLAYASQVYTLYGNDSLDPDNLPEPDKPVQSGRLAYHLRTGAHNLTAYDWQQYLDFAETHWK